MDTTAAACPVCSHAGSTAFYSLSDAPVTCASIFADRKQAVEIPSGSVELAACEACGFVYNPTFDECLGAAGAQYESSQSASAHFTSYARSLANEWVQRHRLTSGRVLEVGCGPGDFLAELIHCGVGSGIGIDPLARSDAVSDARIRLIADAFDETYADEKADALVCRHTLEHLKDVRGFLRSVHAWACAGNARVVLFEVPDSERIFDERAFWDIYYEHCNYFTSATLRLAFELAGFEVLRTELTYGEQYLIIEAVPRTAPEDALTCPDPTDAISACKQFGEDVRASIGRCEASISAFASEGRPLVLWQGASKTVGFLSALSRPVRNLIHGAVDLSKQRHGKFLPASGLPVYAPEALLRLKPHHVVLMNPAYLEEVRSKIANMGVHTQVHAVNDLL